MHVDLMLLYLSALSLDHYFHELRSKAGQIAVNLINIL